MSIQAISAAVAGVRESLLAAQLTLHTARQQLGDAADLLAALSRDHPESLVPPQLHRADEQLGVGLDQVAGTIAAIDRFVAIL